MCMKNTCSGTKTRHNENKKKQTARSTKKRQSRARVVLTRNKSKSKNDYVIKWIYDGPPVFTKTIYMYMYTQP